MRGVTFPGERSIEIMNFPDPTPGPGEVVLEMKASGMCGSDLHQYRRPKNVPRTGSGIPPSADPVIAGHEPCGVVVAVGPGVGPAEAKVGDRMMVHHYQGCTQCSHCRSGWQQLCQEVPVKVYGNNAHGGHAKYLKVPANTMVPLPESLSFTAGAAISCGSGTAYGALRRMNLSGRDTIAIFGQGPVGLAGTQFAKAMGARVIALDTNPQRLERAREFGADELVNPGSNDPVAAIKELTAGKYADLDARHVEQPRRPSQCHPQHQGLGHHVLRGRGRGRHDRRQPAPAAAPDDADRLLDVLHRHPGGVRRSSASNARSTSTGCSRTAGRSTRRTRLISCSTSRRTAKAFS